MFTRSQWLSFTQAAALELHVSNLCNRVARPSAARAGLESSPMKKRILALACLATIVTPAFGGPKVAPEWRVGPRGVGPVHIGMTLAQLKHALHNDIDEYPDPQQECDYLSIKSHPQLQFMMIKRKLVRVDVVNPGIKTPEGIQIGDSAAKVRKVYGNRVESTAHIYIAGGFYLTVLTADKRFGTRFEIDEKGKIGTFYAGDAEAIQYIEGCE